jgi:hypothetical protein
MSDVNMNMIEAPSIKQPIIENAVYEREEAHSYHRVLSVDAHPSGKVRGTKGTAQRQTALLSRQRSSEMAFGGTLRIEQS